MLLMYFNRPIGLFNCTRQRIVIANHIKYCYVNIHFIHVLKQIALNSANKWKQESPAVADKPARRKSMPKIAPIRRVYNVVADDTGLSSFV